MRFFCADSTNIKIRFPLYLPNSHRVKDQRRTKDEPRNDQRTPKYKMCFLLRLPSLFPLLYLPLFHRPMSGRTTTELPVTPKYVLLRFPSSLNSIQQAHNEISLYLIKKVTFIYFHNYEFF